MHIIDQYAYNNRIRHIDPAYKAGLAFMVLLLCLLLSEPLVGLAAVGWMFWLAVRVAGLSARTFGRVLLAEALFLLLTTIGVVVSVSLRNPGQLADWTWQLGPLWFSTATESLYQGLVLVTRALGAASAMNFLALTTPLVDMITLFRRWRLPEIIIDLMTVIYRFIFVLLETLTTMHRAQESRLGYTTTYPRAMNNAALLGSRLFIDAFQRSRRLQTALASRGYEGVLHVLPPTYRTDQKIIWLTLMIAASLILIWIVA